MEEGSSLVAYALFDRKHGLTGFLLLLTKLKHTLSCVGLGLGHCQIACLISTKIKYLPDDVIHRLVLNSGFEKLQKY